MTRKKNNLSFEAAEFTNRVISLVQGLKQEGLGAGRIEKATGISRYRVKLVLRFLNGKCPKPRFSYAQEGVCDEEDDLEPPPLTSKEYVRCQTCGGMVSSERSCYLCFVRDLKSKGLEYAS